MQKKVNVKGKLLMKQPRYFCDLINGGLYQGNQRLRPDMIRAMPEVLTYSANSKAGDEWNLERIPDIVYAAGKEEDYLLILEENQKKTDYGMPLRNMLDVTLAYLQQKKALEDAHKQKHDLKTGSEYLSGLAKKDRLHPIVCITFYHGEEPWDGAERLFDLLSFPVGFEDMKQYCSDFKMNLIHAWNVDPGHFKTGLGTAFELLPYTGDQKKMQDYIKKNEEHFSHLTEDECDALEVFTGMKKFNQQERERFRDPEGGDYNMCTAFVEMVEEGKKEGIKEGIKEGEILLTRLAQAMHADGREEEFFNCCINEELRRRLLLEYGLTGKEQSADIPAADGVSGEC